MKKFIRKTLIFILLTIVFIILGVLVSEYDNLDKSTSENHNIISLQTKSKYDSLEVLFLGNSYCYSSINTHIFDSLGTKSFNLGIATAGVQFYELLINDYYNNVKTYPDKVLILVTPITFSSKSDNFNAYPIHRYLENEKSNLEIAINFNRMNEIFTLYRKSSAKSFNLLLRSFKGENQEKERLNNKGYYPSEKIVDSTVIKSTEHLYNSLKKECFPENKIDDLLQLAQIIEKKGTEVMFFELPTYKLNDYFNNHYLEKYNNGIDRLSKNYKLITINKNKFKKENYRNIDHMNSSGAEIATKELIKQTK